MFIYHDVYGGVATGIEPTENKEEAIANGKNFGLEVFDEDSNRVIYDPRCEHVCLCNNCISAIRSRGEVVYVGPEIKRDEDDGLKCEWCEEDDDTLYDCHY